MKLGYRKLGDFIQQVNNRNSDLSVTNLIGVTLDKCFIPSVANTVGADMSKYKVINKGQFACKLMSVGRDKKLPVSYYTEDFPSIVSSAYYVFEIIDNNELLDDYLMMWFRRPETDRYLGFISGGDVRGSISWDDLCTIEIKVPDKRTQQEIIKEYNTVTNRIKLNEQLNQKLEETAQALYKHWFVDFEFPNEEGKPYKSSGGEMVYNDVLDKEIPVRWEVNRFTEKFQLGGGGTPKTSEDRFWNGDILFFTPADRNQSYYCVETEKKITEEGLKKSSTKIYPKNTVFVTARGTVGAISIAGFDMAMNQSCYSITGDNPFFTHQATIHAIGKLKKEAVGAVFNALVTKDFEGQNVINPPLQIEEKFDRHILNMYKLMLLKIKETQLLTALQSILLSKMSTEEEAIENR